MLLLRKKKFFHAFSALVLLIVLGGIIEAARATSPLLDLGSGHPGLKVATRGAEAVVIYRDEPKTVGAGLQGGMATRDIVVLIDRQYQFRRDQMDIPQQLFPLDENSAFTCEGGSWSSDFKHWEYRRRHWAGYRLVEGQLTTIADVQKTAAEKYRLESGEMFLGFIDGRIFFWKNFDPTRVYWRKLGNATVYRVSMPNGIVDLYGATRGIQKDIGFVAFRKSPGFFHYSLYEHDFVEIHLKDGVLENALPPTRRTSQ